MANVLSIVSYKIFRQNLAGKRVLQALMNIFQNTTPCIALR